MKEQMVLKYSPFNHRHKREEKEKQTRKWTEVTLMYM